MTLEELGQWEASFRDFHARFAHLAMLRHAWALGVPMRWVAGDEIYGNSPDFRSGVEASGHAYVLAVASSTPVWTRRPRVDSPAPPPMGRPRTKTRLAAGAPAWKTVAEVAAKWSASRWERFAVAEGEKGPRVYDWARSRVVERRGGLPGPEVWLLARHSASAPAEIAYYLCLAPREVTLRRLAEVASARFTIEQCFEEGKGETGLDQYEVRHYASWHRHITLAMMALAWLASIRARRAGKKEAALAELSVPKVVRLLGVALPLPAESPEFDLAWSHWRRASVRLTATWQLAFLPAAPHH
jgi:SRSO17 transposase